MDAEVVDLAQVENNQRIFLPLQRIENVIGHLLFEAELDLLERPRGSNDRQLTVTFERERLIGRRRILDGHHANSNSLNRNFGSHIICPTRYVTHYSRVFHPPRQALARAHAEGRQFENARTTS